jgi:hypothetical protein
VPLPTEEITTNGIPSDHLGAELKKSSLYLDPQFYNSAKTGYHSDDAHNLLANRSAKNMSCSKNNIHRVQF